MNLLVSESSRVAVYTSGDHVTRAQYEADKSTVVEVINELGNQLQTSNALLKNLQTQLNSSNGEKQAILAEVQTLKDKQQQDEQRVKELLERVQRVAQENRDLQAAAMNQVARNQELGLQLNGVKRECTALKEKTEKREALLKEKAKLDKTLEQLSKQAMIGTAGSSGAGALTGAVTGFFIGGPLGAAAGFVSGGGAGLGSAKLVEKKTMELQKNKIQKRLQEIDKELKALDEK